MAGQWSWGAKPRNRLPLGPAAQWSNVGLVPGLIDKDKPGGTKATREALPAYAPSRYINTTLFNCKQLIYEAESLAAQKPPERIMGHFHTTLGQHRLQLA